MVNGKFICLPFVVFFDGEVFAKMCILVCFFGDDDVCFRGSSDTCIAINCCLPIDVSVLPVIINKKTTFWLIVLCNKAKIFW